MNSQQHKKPPFLLPGIFLALRSFSAGVIAAEGPPPPPAPLRRVTLVLNEQNYQVFELNAPKFERTFTDATPLAAENRYYLRVGQTDGSMA